MPKLDLFRTTALTRVFVLSLVGAGLWAVPASAAQYDCSDLTAGGFSDTWAHNCTFSPTSSTTLNILAEGTLEGSITVNNSASHFHGGVISGDVTEGLFITDVEFASSSSLAIGGNLGTKTNSADAGLSLWNATGLNVLSIIQGGSIASAKNGLSIYGSPITSLTNAGVIVGKEGYGATISGDIDTFINTATGSITSEAGLFSATNDPRHALAVQAATVNLLTNNGLIRANASTGLLVASENGIRGQITTLNNTGTIASDSGNGLLLDPGAQITNLNNSGEISGGENMPGITLNNGSIETLNNSGTINGSGVGYGVVLQDYDSNNTSSITTFINSGTINGYVYAITVDANSRLDTLQIAGDNTAVFNGTVQGRGTNVVVMAGSTYTLTDKARFYSSNFRNEGTLRLEARANNEQHELAGFSATADSVLEVQVTDTDYTRLALDKGFSRDDSGTLYSVQNVLGGILHVDASGLTENHSYQSSTVDGVTTLAGFITPSANGSIHSEFASVKDNSALFDFSVDYVFSGAYMSSVDLKFQAASNTSARQAVDEHQRRTARGAADALDAAFDRDSSSPLASLFMPLADSADVADAVESTLPLMSGSGTQGVRASTKGMQRIVQSTQGAGGISSGEAGTQDGRYWLKPFGNWADQNDQDGIAGYESNTYGFVAGADAELTDTSRFGVAFGYGNTNMDSKSKIAPQSTDINSFQLIGFGSYKLGVGTEIFGQADLGYHTIDGKRVMPLLGESAKAEYDSYSAHAAMGAGHTLKLIDSVRFTPSARVDYAIIHDTAYTESGAGALNLKVDSRNTDEFIASIDGALDVDVTKSTIISANAGVGYDFIGERAGVTSAYTGASDLKFNTYGADPEQWIYRAGLGIAHSLENNTEVSLRYDGEYRDGFAAHGASLKARMNF